MDESKQNKRDRRNTGMGGEEEEEDGIGWWRTSGWPFNQSINNERAIFPRQKKRAVLPNTTKESEC